jgi:hypothetical protein
MFFSFNIKRFTAEPAETTAYLKERNNGIMEQKYLNPLFHHSSIPIFQCFSDSIIPGFQFILLCVLCDLCG